MIRIWKGLEKETVFDEPDLMTLFVCSDAPFQSDKIIELLSDNSDVKSLYLGAGRTDFYGTVSSKDWDLLVSYCKRNGIRIILEVSPAMLNAFIRLYSADIVTFIVAYYNIPTNVKNLYFKTDDFTVTNLFTLRRGVDVTCLVSNMYPDDVLIYEED